MKDFKCVTQMAQNDLAEEIKSINEHSITYHKRSVIKTNWNVGWDKILFSKESKYLNVILGFNLKNYQGNRNGSKNTKK